MAHWRRGKLLGFDLETTGTDPGDDVPVSWALAIMEEGTVTTAESGLVNPGRPIPAAATAVHGITGEMVKESGRDLGDTVFALADTLVSASQEGTPLVGMNLRYDLAMVSNLAKRFLGETLPDLGWDGPVLDVLVIDRHCDRFRKGPRKLANLCEHYQVEAGGFHDAAADVKASLAVLLAETEAYPDALSRDPREIHAAEAAWHREWAEGFSAWLVSKGKDPLPAEELAWPLPISEIQLGLGR